MLIFHQCQSSLLTHSSMQDWNHHLHQLANLQSQQQASRANNATTELGSSGRVSPVPLPLFLTAMAMTKFLQGLWQNTVSLKGPVVLGGYLTHYLTRVSESCQKVAHNNAVPCSKFDNTVLYIRVLIH